MRPSSFASPGKWPETFVHVLPASRVTCTRPSSLPVQITLESVGAKLTVSRVPYVSAPEMSYSIGPPLVTCFAFSVRVGSGLVARHGSPPSLLLTSTLPPRYTVFASRGDTAMGVVQLNRYVRFAGFISLTLERYGRIERVSPVFRFTRVMLPFCEST